MVALASRVPSAENSAAHALIGFFVFFFGGSGAGTAWAQNEMFVTNLSSVTVYSQTASGNAAPIRTLSGAATGLNAPAGVAVDTAHNELFVVNFSGDSVTVYDRNANGNAAPIRTLVGAATGLSESNAIVVDTVNDELVLTNDLPYSILVYPRTASGNTAPIRTLVGAATGLGLPYGLVVDTVHDELVVANRFGSITVYDRTASGNAAPIRTLTSGAFNGPIGLVVDTVNDELIVTSEIANSVTVFGRTASGSVAPTRQISGAATGLSTPDGLVVDTVNNEILVANGTNNSVTVYSRTATGNVAPIRTLKGAATSLNGPFYLTTAGPTAPVLAQVVSRKVHGGAGTFDLLLSLANIHNPTTEPRQGPAQTIVFTFDKPISAATAAVTEGAATAGTPTFSGNDVTVPLTGVSNKQYVTVTLSNVSSTDGGSGGTGVARVGYLLGDVNGNRVVTVSDILLVNQQIAHAVTSANFLKDVNANGNLTVSDKLIVNNNVTKALPAP